MSRLHNALAKLHVTSNYRVDLGWQKAADKPFFTQRQGGSSRRE